MDTRYLVVALLAGCAAQAFDENGGSTDKRGTTGPMVFAARPEPAGTSCANGGVALLSGPDANLNGSLDPGEVTSTQYVCNGANGLTTLLATSAAGSSCASGGTRIDAGADADRDGVLDANEISATTYVCHGASGADGQSALIRTTDLAAGAGCAAGGVRVQAGLDTDRDSVLDDAEVTSSTVICDGTTTTAPATNPLVRMSVGITELCPAGGYSIEAGSDTDADGVLDPAEVQSTSWLCFDAVIHHGDILIDSPDDLAQLRYVTIVDGNVTVTGAGLSGVTAVVGPLAAIEGDLTISGTQATVFASGLTRIGGSLRVTGNPSLTFINLSSLDTVAGTVEISGNAGLPNMWGLDRIQHVGSLIVADNPKLESLAAYSGHYEFGELVFGLQGLRTVDQDVRISNNPNVSDLWGISRIQLVGGNFVIEGLPLLTDLSVFGWFPLGGTLRFSNNPALSVCQEQLLVQGWLEGDTSRYFSSGDLACSTYCCLGSCEPEVCHPEVLVPTEVAFMDINEGQTSWENIEVSVGNGGTAGGELSFSLSGGDAGQFALTGQTGFVMPGVTTQINLRFLGGAIPGTYATTLVVSVGNSTALVQVTARVIKIATLESLTPTALDFGVIAVGRRSASIPVTLVNSGDLEGAAEVTAGFPFSTAGGCFWFIGNCTMSAYVKSFTTGLQTSTLQATMGGVTKTASMTASYLPMSPRLSGMPEVEAMWPTTVGSTYTAYFAVENTGLTDTATLGASFGSRPGYTLLDDGCTGVVLSPGDTCTMVILFAPTTTQAYESLLTITDGDTVQSTVMWGAGSTP
jgi:hypothetical protein